MDRDDLPAILHRLERWRETHRNRGVLYRVTWVLSGFVVLLTGLAMTVLPGPAVVVIPLGLAMLSLEFVWAERLLDVSVRRGLQAKNSWPTRRLVILGFGTACAVTATSVALLLYL
ncbi:MAG TPA: PGPGW domain-containing protein [Gaiellaceae bacterium]